MSGLGSTERHRKAACRRYHGVVRELVTVDELFGLASRRDGHTGERGFEIVSAATAYVSELPCTEMG